MSVTAEQGINIGLKTMVRKENFNTWEKTIVHKTLVDPKHILLLPLYIKFDLVKHFLHLSEAKLKYEIFVGL